MDRSAVAAALLDRLSRLKDGSSFCPSEVARALADDWRPLMPPVREVAAEMPQLVATQKGAPVDPETTRGPIQLRRA